MYTEDGDALLGPRNLQLHAVIPGQYRGVPLAGAATSIIFVAIKRFVATKYVFYNDKSMPVTTKLLSRQNYVCHNNHVFVTTKVYLSRQTRICRDKSFVVIKNILSRQTYFCCDKHTFDRAYWSILKIEEKRRRSEE